MHTPGETDSTGTTRSPAGRAPGPVPPGADGPGVGPNDLTRRLAVARAGDETLPHFGVVGDTYTMLVTGEQTEGRYALIDMFVPPEGGPPPHRHDFEEMFHVLEGEFQVTFRGERLVLQARDTINIPARTPHFFHNSSGREARVLCMVSPAGLEEYFTLWGLPLPTRTSIPQMDDDEAQARLDTAIELGPRYHIENLAPEG